jgi:hypothetical protein
MHSGYVLYLIQTRMKVARTNYKPNETQPVEEMKTKSTDFLRATESQGDAPHSYLEQTIDVTGKIEVLLDQLATTIVTNGEKMVNTLIEGSEQPSLSEDKAPKGKPVKQNDLKGMKEQINRLLLESTSVTQSSEKERTDWKGVDTIELKQQSTFVPVRASENVVEITQAITRIEKSIQEVFHQSPDERPASPREDLNGPPQSRTERLLRALSSRRPVWREPIHADVVNNNIPAP